MNLREPKKKKRLKVQSCLPFPINFNGNDEWTMYTAHLGIFGACIVDSQEMTAIHSMGFFGKGMLSRSFPDFGKRRFGAPPQVRDRQWKRREQWLDEVNKLHSETFPFIADEHDNEDDTSNFKSNEHNEKDTILDESMETNDIIDENINSNAVEEDEITAESSKSDGKNCEIDEVVLDSTEEEEICEIVDHNETNDDEDCVLNNKCINSPLQPDEYFDRVETPRVEKNEAKLHETLVLPDSDSDTENYLKNIKPKIKTEGFPLTETLQLTFEETFFLMYGLGCLQLINYDGKLFSIIDAWNHFNEQDEYFLPKYIIYHYFRSKGWVVKPGLKFGCDFLLYKQGPPFYHASYIVNVETVDGHSLIRDDIRSTRKLTWNNLLQLNRLSEVTAKEFLIAQVVWPSTISLQSNPVPLEALSEFTVRELLWRRWKPTQSDELISLDNDDDDSDDEDSS
ncbi:hypothetical protein PV327_005106 [Microctonus hyperodae]|uniref:tRNA-splicing endonuclease subunit Sen2 n=1 Tax=Microctonus hyperodae TaxID=165561 RepID=A0AA39G0R1_MICHY|nr:hypothetical protein PV327_005106 [Microctonus hyperodae]